VHVRGYRSVRDVHLELGQLNVLVGPNGCGKTNLYRGLRLLADAAEARLARSLAEEGGMPSVLWAGLRRRGQRARLIVGAQVRMQRVASAAPRSRSIRRSKRSASGPTSLVARRS
jgi:predicted ATPase